MVLFSCMVKRFYPSHLKRRRRKLLVVGVGLVSLILLGAGGLFYKLVVAKPKWETYINDSLDVQLEYPRTFAETPIDEQNEEVGVVFRIEREKPNALFSLRYEEGLGALKLAGGTVFEALVATINRRYPDRFPDYKKDVFDEFILGNEKAALFDFTYTGADGETRIKQRFVVVVKDNTAYYLSCQAPEKEFFKSEKDFDRIISSFEFVD